MSNATYTPEQDVIEPYSDGSGNKVIVKAGTPIAWATAYELGLVSTKRPPKTESTEPQTLIAPELAQIAEDHANSRKR